jgi:hypothetical protein
MSFQRRPKTTRTLMAICFYKFVGIHQTLKVTPAMAVGVTAKVWKMTDLVKALERWEAAQ